MKRYLFDSNSLSAWINHHPKVSDHYRAKKSLGHPIGTCVPIVAEMLYGIEMSISRDKNLLRLHRALKLIKVWPFDLASAAEYGIIASDLKLRGRKMQILDMMMAAVAKSMGTCVVVTSDTDLSAVPGLTVENWLE